MDALSDKLLLEIFSWLRASAELRLKAVCTRWRDLIQSDIFRVTVILGYGTENRDEEFSFGRIKLSETRSQGLVAEATWNGRWQDHEIDELKQRTVSAVQHALQHYRISVRWTFVASSDPRFDLPLALAIDANFEVFASDMQHVTELINKNLVDSLIFDTVCPGASASIKHEDIVQLNPRRVVFHLSGLDEGPLMAILKEASHLISSTQIPIVIEATAAPEQIPRVPSVRTLSKQVCDEIAKLTRMHELRINSVPLFCAQFKIALDTELADMRIETASFLTQHVLTQNERELLVKILCKIGCINCMDINVPEPVLESMKLDTWMADVVGLQKINVTVTGIGKLMQGNFIRHFAPRYRRVGFRMRAEGTETSLSYVLLVVNPTEPTECSAQ